MTNDERQQADLLEEFRRQRATNSQATPPDGLDPGIAAVSARLDDGLIPPGPSDEFVRQLEHQLEATATPVSNHHQSGPLPPASDAELAVTSASTEWHTASEPRRSRLSEFTRIAAAGLAIMLVGTVLVMLFRDAGGSDAPAPAASDTGIIDGEILVSWDPNGGENYKLYVIDASGEYAPRKLTPGPHEDDGVTERFGSWSPDGQRVTFVREEAGQTDILVIDANGANMVNLTQSPGHETAPIWSPDAQRIAFVTDGNLHVMEADGSNVRPVTTFSGGGLAYPAWSPDGQQFAFGRIREDSATGTGSFEIWVVNADGSDPQPITNLGKLTENPQWSSDGDLIAFWAGSRIWVVEPDGSNPHPISGESRSTSAAAWSNDGEQVVFPISAAPDGGDGIATATRDGETQNVWFSTAATVLAPQWSPDDSWIAFFAGDGPYEGPWRTPLQELDWELEVSGPDGSSEHTLLANGALDFLWAPAWRPVVTGDVPAPAATPTPGITETPVPADPTPSSPDDPRLPTPPASSDFDPVTEAFPDAEVVHVVSEELQENGEVWGTETWIDQVSGDVIVQRYGDDGVLMSATMRQGLTVTGYSHSAFTVYEVLSEDDPILHGLDSHLFGYRELLQDGDGEIVGEEMFNGQRAIKVSLQGDSQVIGDEPFFYLDPVTLFPLGTEGFQTNRLITYPTIETLPQSAMPVELFDMEFPPSLHEYHMRELTPEQVEQFNEYAVWGLNPPWPGYTLDSIERVRSTLPDDGTDVINLIYRGENEDDIILIRSHGELSGEERQLQQDRWEYEGEQVTIRGESGWLTPMYGGSIMELNGGTRLEFDWRGVFLTIIAPDRETAIDVAETMRQINPPQR